MTFRAFLQREVPHEEIAPQIGRSLFELFDEYDARRQPEMVAHYRKVYADLHDDWVRLFPGVEALLTHLAQQDVRVGVVTSKSQASAWPALTRFGLMERLETLVTYDDTVQHKPHPAPLLLAAERLQLTPGQCWYVGDAIHDIVAAQSAGMVAVGALWGASEPERLRAEAHHCIVAPENLLMLL